MLGSATRHLSLLGSSRSLTAALESARFAQARWSQRPVAHRLQAVRRLRRLLVDRGGELADAVELPERRFKSETLCAEILPLADACRFLERRAVKVLRRRRIGGGRPPWSGGVSLAVDRLPWGLVLVVGAGNYPIFLPGVQTLQALVAGNGVLLKPAPGVAKAAGVLADLFAQAGFESDLLVLLDSAPETAQRVTAAGVDKILFTGSSATGRKVLHQAADRLTPATLELSGCDAVFVTPRADLVLVSDALRFGVSFNSGATCIAPRRVFVPRARGAELEALLRARFDGIPATRLEPHRLARLQAAVADALRTGARLISGPGSLREPITPVVLTDVSPEMEVASTDLFGPIISILPVEDMDEALEMDKLCPYALGATVFGPPREARRIARRIGAGIVVINDMIAPTADPRVAFGGRGESGFGVTRGADGLLELTRPRVVAVRGGRWRPHLQPLEPGDEAIFASLLKARHGRSWRRRAGGWLALSRAVRARSRATTRK